MTAEALQGLLKEFSEAVGVSGGETEIRKLILERLKDKVSDITIDPIGNISAIKKGTGASSLRVLLTAHMDEIGFMVTDVGDNGLTSVDPIGKHDKRFLAAQRVWVGKDKQPGVFLWVPIHVNPGQFTVVGPDSMQIDVGADGKGGVRAQPGDRVAFIGQYRALTDTVVRGKAFDRSAACAAVLALIEADPFPFDLCLTFTTQFQIGGRGALLAARRFQPDISISLTGVSASDLPPDLDEEDKVPVIRLGGGPVLRVKGLQSVQSRKLIAHLKQTAQSRQIPLQVNAFSADRSEADAIDSTLSGVQSVLLAVPIRYMETPNSLLNLNDLTHLIDLTRDALDALTPDILENRS